MDLEQTRRISISLGTTMVALCCAVGSFVKTYELSSDAMRLHRAVSSLNAEVSCVRYNHNGKIIASCSVDGGICLDVAASGELLSRFFYPAKTLTDRRVNAVHFSSGSRFLASGGGDGCVRVWDLKSQEVTQTYTIGASAVTSVTFSGYKDDFIVAGSEAGAISVCDVQSSETVGFLSVDAKYPVASVTSVVASPHPYARQMIGSSYGDGSVRVWDMHTAQLSAEFANQHDDSATCVAISPVSKVLLVSGGLDQRVLFFDTLQRRELRSMDLDAPVSSLALCADGKTLAVGTTSGHVFVYDLRGAITPLHGCAVHDGSGEMTAVRSLQFATPSSDNSNAIVFPTGQPVIATERVQVSMSPTKQDHSNGACLSPKQSSTMQVSDSARHPEVPTLFSPPIKTAVHRHSGFAISANHGQPPEVTPLPPSQPSPSELAILQQHQEELLHPPSLLNAFERNSPTRLRDSQPSRNGEPSLLSMLAEPSPTRLQEPEPRTLPKPPLPLTSPTSYSSRVPTNNETDRQSITDQVDLLRIQMERHHAEQERSLAALLQNVLAKYDALVDENLQLRRENESLRSHLQ